MSKPPRLLDDVALMWWFAVTVTGAGILSGSSTEKIDLQGVIGIALLTLGFWRVYAIGLRRDRD